MIWNEGIVEFEYPDPDAPKLGWAEALLPLKNVLIVRDDNTGSETSIRVNRSQFTYTASLLDVASTANVAERGVNEEQQQPTGAEVGVTR